ncbi:unnamed protein product [Oikopleura dioica]|uniref:Uncharacterized protein n=1 Tax=Oikopleura dioica TaxID=34765 RepID=E4WR74_OIKDI|nr:unnamed protein product [Oikopleura dioica]
MQREGHYNQGTPRKEPRSVSNILCSTPTVSNPANLNRQCAIDLVEICFYHKNSLRGNFLFSL